MNILKKKMNGGSTNNFSYKNNSRRTYFSKKRGRELNKRKERSNRRGSTRRGSIRRGSTRRGSTRRGSTRRIRSNSTHRKTTHINSNNTIMGISNLPSLFDSQNNNTSTAIESLSQINNTNEESLLSPKSNNIPKPLVENTYRVKNTKKARNNFNILRNEIKNSHNIEDTMFKFGQPTELINNFLYSLYNENIIYLEQNKLMNKELNTNMMMSVAELDDEPNILYITISEEPFTPTDKQFYSKIARLLHMIEIMLLKSNYNNNRIGMKDFKYDNLKKNYTYAKDRITLLDIEEENIDNIFNEPSYKSTYRQFNENYNFDGTFKAPKRIKKGLKTIRTPAYEYNEYRRLLPDNLKIKFVFNTKYILERNNFGRSLSYRPFLKEEKSNPNFVACNSGSICSESKLFSYLHDNNLFKKVKGTIAYWVGKGTKFGKECHPKGKVNVGICNYHPNYALEKNEDTKEDLLDDMITILKNENKISKELLQKSPTKNFKNVFRAFALPCPGCYLNGENYVKNNRTLWDNSRCLEYNLKKRTDDKNLQKAAELHPGQ